MLTSNTLTLKKCSFNLCLKLSSKFGNFISVDKLFQTIDQEICLLNDFLISKQKISYLLEDKSP